MPEPILPQEDFDEKPPIMGTWNNLYILVLVLHAFIILLFYFFTRIHS